MAILFHICLVLEKVVNRKLFELFDFRCFIDNLLRQLALEIVYRCYVLSKLSFFVHSGFLSLY